ncbi:MAG TPA: dihydrofolate reductase [Candidatus Paceibacterota bacterium]|nr:dihydrofolate reductase [Candidatus Paceibacterota bacterium]
MKIYSLIVAVAEDNLVIGDGKKILWHLPTDMKSFAEITKKAGVIIIGRTSYETLPTKFRPLPDRVNIVVTRKPSWVPDRDDNVIVVHSLPEALAEAEKLPGEEICVIGGGEIYREALKHIVLDKMYITYVQGNFEGTTTLPKGIFTLLRREYKITKEQKFRVDERHDYPFRIVHYEYTPVIID